MDGKYIYFIGTDLNISSQFLLKNTSFCSSYLQIKQKYLLLCDQTFLLVNRSGIEYVFPHYMNVNFFNKNNYEMQYDSISSN